MKTQCLCGCGRKVTKEENIYIQGHNWTGKKLSDEHKQKISVMMSVVMNQPEVRKKWSKTTKRLWQNPIYRAKNKATWSKPEVIAQHKQKMKAILAKPEVKARQKAGMKKAWKNPELRTRHKIAMNLPKMKAKQKMRLKKLWQNPIYREKISLGMTGEKHPFWKGGKSFEPYSPEFNKQLKLFIRQRDNFTCQECNYTEEQLGYTFCSHHIDYDKKNSNPNNLILLCKSCNNKANFKREDWANHFQDKIRRIG